MSLMARVAAWASIGLLAFARTAQGQTMLPVELVPPPLDLAMQVRAPESIYAPPEAMAEEQAINAGGVNFRLDATFFSDYIFRGIDRSESSGTEDSGNMEIEGQMRFELGKL